MRSPAQGRPIFTQKNRRLFDIVSSFGQYCGEGRPASSMYVCPKKSFALSGADLGQMRQVARYEGLRVEIHNDFPLKRKLVTQRFC